MATKKKSTKTQTKTKSKVKRGSVAAVHLPNGFKVIGRAPNWEPEKNPVIEGERGPTNTMTMDEGKKTEREVRNCVVQDAELGAVTVWESGMLRQFFDETDDGDVVRIEFLGLGKPAQRGHNPPKLFSCAVKE